MKTEWLDGNMWRAKLTRGWFRKREVVVNKSYHDDRWKYEGTDTLVGDELDAILNRDRSERHWQAVYKPRKAGPVRRWLARRVGR